MKTSNSHAGLPERPRLRRNANRVVHRYVVVDGSYYLQAIVSRSNLVWIADSRLALRFSAKAAKTVVATLQQKERCYIRRVAPIEHKRGDEGAENFLQN